MTANADDTPNEPTELGRLLDLLNIVADERISICTEKPGKPFMATVPINRSDAVALAYNQTNRDRHVWFGVIPLRRRMVTEDAAPMRT